MIVDHMTELLVTYAEEADYETQQATNNTPGRQAAAQMVVTQETTNNQKVERALSCMDGLLRRLIHGTKNPPDYRKFASYYLALHQIRVQFALNNFKQVYFNYIDRVDQQEINMLPKAWHVQVSYYRGRYHMYNNDFVKARDELTKAFAMANRD